MFYRGMFFIYISHTFQYYITLLFVFLNISKAECIILKLSPSGKFISFNRRKSISLTATCILGSRLLPMFRLHGIDRWNPRRCMRRLRKSGGFETGARRQIKILCRIRRKRATVSDAEQTMDVIAFVTAAEYVTFVSIFTLLFYVNILSILQMMWITDAYKLYATRAISFNRIIRDWY